jgi:16S rRNA (guanine527-N7)-methyltransferase
VQVSRETDLPPAEILDRWFGPGAPGISRYVGLLGGEGIRRGVIGPRELPRLWSRHVMNCVVVHPLIAPDSSVADLGSGAGLPGIVLALARPDLDVTLVEPLLRRTRFLDLAVGELELSNVAVVRARAEDLAGQAAFDVVVARAVARLDRLIWWALPLCRAGGELLALKGGNARDELDGARASLARMGAGRAVIQACGVGVVQPATTVVRIQSSAPTSTGEARRDSGLRP